MAKQTDAQRRKAIIADLNHWAREAHGMWIIGEENGMAELRSVLRRAADELKRIPAHPATGG